MAGMINARYLVMGVLALGGGAALLHGPAAKPVLATSSNPLTPAPRVRAVTRPKNVLVFVAGAVNRPGLYTLPEGARAVLAVEKAGGLRADADPAGVDLAQPLSDGEEIAAPVAGAPHRSSSAHGIRKPASRARARSKKAPPAVVEPVDLNAADAATLATLPGIGQELARRLVAFREANGDFANLDELADVAGMTQSRIDAVTPYLYVNR